MSLLDNEPAPVALLGLEQKLHGRPANALETHAVDQVDDDRSADQGAGHGQESGIDEEIKHEAQSFGDSS